jgi:hypothetical protein
MRKLTLALFLMLIGIASAATVTGYVHDAYGRPMAETSVEVDGTDVSAVCNSQDGSFTLSNVPTGEVTLLVLYHDAEVHSLDVDVSASGYNYTKIDLPIVCENGTCRIVK